MKSPSEAQQIRVVFRYDDYSNFSPTRFEERLIEAFRERQLGCAFGIIPFACQDQLDARSVDRSPLSDDKAALLKKAVRDGTVEPMLHGYAHRVRPRQAQDRPPSELSGLDLAEQRELLAEGKALLEELLQIEVKLFAPPWNSYDLATLRALEDLEVECFSAGPRFGAVKKRGPLSYLPATCLLHSLRDAVAAARKIADTKPIVVALFHAYDFVEAEPVRGVMSLGDLAELLDWVSAQEDLMVVSMGSTIEAGEDLGGRRFALNRSLKKKLALTPPFLRRFYMRAPKIYLSGRAAARMKSRNDLLLGSFYLAVMLLSSLLSAIGALPLLPGTAMLREWAMFGGAAVVIAVGLYALRHARLTYKGALAIALVGGVYIGALIAVSLTPADL